MAEQAQHGITLVRVAQLMACSGFLSIIDLCLVMVLWISSHVARTLFRIFKDLCLWYVKHRMALFIGVLFGMAMNVACGASSLVDVAFAAPALLLLMHLDVIVGKLSGWLSEKYELTEEENSKICREEEFQTQAQLKPLKRERRVFDLANLSDMETSMQHSSSTVGFSGDAGVTAVMNDPVAVDEARQILKLDSRSIERLMLQDEKLASKLEYLYAKTGDFKLRKAISVAKWRIRYWLRKP
jgi:hypothetical protein